MKPVLIQGGSHVDARGALRFCNDFDMSAVKRFYTIANSAEQPVRGWIGHKRETKWFFPLRGITTIVVESMDDSRAERADRVEAEENDSTWLQKYTLSSDTPSVLKVQSGNWFCIKQDGNAEVMVFSDCKVGEFKDDDFRRPYDNGRVERADRVEVVRHKEHKVQKEV